MPGSSAVETLAGLPEAFVSDTAISREVSRAVKAGGLRKLASRLYTRNLTDPPPDVVRRNLWSIVAGYFPGALIADRTALENAPARDGSICLVTRSGGEVRLPGIVLRPRRGVGPTASDRPFLDRLHLSSTARAFLENMRPSRARRDLLGRTLTRLEIEERLDALIRHSGEDAARRLRDDVRAAAAGLGMPREAAALDGLIASLLGTGKGALRAPAALARQRGRPFDPDRLELFRTLHGALRSRPPVTRLAPDRGTEARSTLAFFEAYFSNFIEGTEFAVEEAAGIVFRGVIPAERPRDAHDVLGTWRIVSDAAEMRRTATGAALFLRLLKARHRTIMQSRPDVRPGAFKLAGNRAGSTFFVAPELVTGTLERAFELHRSLETPFERAVFAMFLVSEVHPFADGNGRTARIMMNAELQAADEERIVIPTVYRANYLSALRALSRTGRPEPLIRVLDYAQRWTAAIGWGAVPETQRELDACDAFVDPDVAEQEGRRLRMPGL